MNRLQGTRELRKAAFAIALTAAIGALIFVPIVHAANLPASCGMPVEDDATAQSECARSAATSVMQPYQEYSKKIRAAEQAEPLNSSLFGDQVNVYDQSTVFYHTDVDVPGSNQLRVALSRRLDVRPVPFVGAPPQNYGGLADWDVEVPYISGTFDSAYGWNYGVGGNMPRCSTIFRPITRLPNRTEEIWSGYHLHVPGEGSRSLVALPPSQFVKPDGKTRVWGTSRLDTISCTPTVSGYPGEGFIVETAAGIKYTFNVATQRSAGEMARDGDAGGISRPRVEVFLLASRAEDRFGNWVTYSYNGNGHPVAITGSDGRSISLSYSGARLASATTNGRSWVYSYSGDTLQQVRLPDQSTWKFNHLTDRRIVYQYWDVDPGPGCGAVAPLAEKEYTLRMTHPAGAQGDFTFNHQRLYRSGVPSIRCQPEAVGGDLETGPTVVHNLDVPFYFDVLGLRSKTITGPGMASQAWSYADYVSYQPLWGGIVPPCLTCQQSKSVLMSQPDGGVVEEIYGIVFDHNEGRLLERKIMTPTGQVLRHERNTYLAEAAVASQPFPGAYGSAWGVSDSKTAAVRPVVEKTIAQDGVTFTWKVNSFDVFARPSNVTRSSTLGHVKTEATVYHDNLAQWVLGQEGKLTDVATGMVEIETTYNAAAMPIQQYAFGRLHHTLAYSADGTLFSVQDGNGNLTTLGQWKRGVPQSITHPGNVSQSASVDNNGWITAITDENGFSTSFGYDAMGRLASVAHPTGDAMAWNQTTHSFLQVQSAEYGIPAGHWRKTVATGNARNVTYYDGWWRPLLVHEYDASNVAATQRFQRFSYGYDSNGALNFVSYPGPTDALSAGRWTSYDPLGRVRGQSQSSELGTLTTNIEYLSGFRIRVTDPRGQQTVTSYQAWDQPIQDFPVAIAQPGGVHTDIARDAFGKPTAITQRNAGNTQSLTRRYVYDTHQQLCKTIEPETGSTVMAYDNAGNLSWSAAGQALPSVTSCNTASVAANQRVSRSYDVRNRLTSLAFPDGNGNQTWSYTPDGLPLNVTTYNNAGSSTVTNSYAYNRRRLMTGEGQAQTDGFTWSIGYGYDANGHLASVVHPSTLTVNYVPNALGQPTQAGMYASNVQYHPNGAMKQFTYGNGLVRTIAQNGRQLPSRITDSGGVLDLAYTYDRNGNVSAITDHTSAGRQTRSMTYDGRDRLLTVTSPLYPGGATYAYDALDNLTRVTVAGRDHRYLYDASNRLTNVTDGAGGPSVIGLGYDVRGNVNNKNGQIYGFDHGNRLRGALGTESYRYDAYGRRVRTQSNSALLYEMYSQSGQLLWQRDEQVGNRYDYIYLNGAVVAVRSRPIGSEAHDPIYWHTDLLGSQIAATVGTSVVQTTEHEPYGRMLNREPHNRVAYTGHVMDMATKLSYMQQRYYDPSIGMMLSVDPVTAHQQPITNFCRYCYARNNPYTFNDPDGREAGFVYHPDGRMTNHFTENELNFSRASFALDFVPVVGDIKAVVEAIMDPSAANIAAAGVGLVPVVGDVSGKIIKQGGNIAENAARGKAGEAATRAKLGDNVSGEQVTFRTSDGTRTRADFVTRQGDVVETKTGGARLSPGQVKLQGDINSGRQVTPVGRNAERAGLPSGQPINMRSCTVDRPGC